MKSLLLLLLLACPAAAEESLPTGATTTASQTAVQAPVSPPGAKLIIKDWVCVVQGDHGIRCDNTSDYCVALFARVKAFHKHIFGCVIKGSPNYPCDFNEIDPMSDGNDKSLKGQYQTFRFNYETCGPHGVGTYTIREPEDQ